MEKLINSIKLISFNYMYSSNKTVDKFGIEYSYIASAMGNMLKSTNNGIKNVNIDKTIGIAVDWNWGCIDATIGDVLIMLGLIALIGAFVASAPATGGISVAVGSWFLVGLTIALVGIAYATYNTGNSCFGGW